MKLKKIIRPQNSYAAILALLLFSVFLTTVGFAQVDTLRVATYNILQFPDAEYAARLHYYRIVLNEIDPDILVVQEMKSQEGVDNFLNEVLNYYQADKYTAAPFISGPDDDNAMFYKADKIALVSNRQISTNLRDISEYVLFYIHLADPTEFRVYSLDFKAYNNDYSKNKRFSESLTLRNELNELSPDTHFFVCGSFNFYTTSEQGFGTLTGIMSDNDGRCFDPINRTGDWYLNQTFADIHTQSTRTTEFGGGGDGGMNERADMIMVSSAVIDGIVYDYLDGTYTTFGNDAQHFTSNINDDINQSVPDSVADALYYASDHVPVYLDFTVSGMFVPVELSNFKAMHNGNNVNLTWATATESDNYGFYIERKNSSNSWQQIGFAPGHGTTATPHNYSYIDENMKSGDYFYRLKQVDFDGQFTHSEIVHVAIETPDNFTLEQNYPNPFNSSTIINFKSPKKSNVKITLYNMLGKEILILTNKEYEPGSHKLEFNAANLKSGLYFYKLETSEFWDMKKFMFLK